ncbi:2-amino-4-hydroxy-6-hydroxymethyldihydropteridine diphosphokinase [Thioalkalivibrio denitrificans]|uniref:2-amino-4-hydroxy-6-hydroxymethyldihydropteridine pyrophosphokinase n=1 Tax=Thioalkalivibrio denitrificans TaxID=108003 RepID=A0A1V3NG87_9GAMM|nr:2-amino-4-hydroxy-6-hydroxymethyldihydropteridine diphosphokinase [Thioalkalivibrio denitrificans]OOG23796.1 2-amino-4-hydroxy-6-hydroxymethyldihydropteridine diphosphokinase [Thioalkalivibrio denitrificans]
MAEVIAYVGLGSNLENPVDQVSKGLEALERLPRTRCLARSSLYTSPPMGPPGQPDYVNAVACLATGLSALELLEALMAVERTHGRLRDGTRWGPRTLDLDILLYGDARIDSPQLRVPHPGIPERPFVLYPLAEIAPGDLDLPGLGSLTGLKAGCPRGGLNRLEGGA